MAKHSSFRAILLALCGYTCWVIGDTFVKIADETGMPKYEIMALAGICGMVTIFLLCAVRGKIRQLRPRKYGALAGLAVLFGINYLVWVTALSRLPLANLYVVLFLAPTLVAIFAAIFLKERLTFPKILAILAGFVGVVIAVNPSYLIQDKKDWLSYGFALIGMVSLAVQMIIMRLISKHENREATAFYPRIGAVVAGLVAMFIFGFEPVSLKGFLCCLGTGTIGAFGWIAMAQAYKMAPAAIVAPFHYSQLLTGALFGYLVWHDIPSPHLAVGALVIMVAGVYIVMHARKMEAILEEETHG